MGVAYKVRDPIVLTRDPVPCSVVPKVTPVLRPKVNCPACGGWKWKKHGTTKPNPATSEMYRWRRCEQCGKAAYIARPMTNDERKTHC